MIKEVKTKFPITLKNTKPLVFFDLETTGVDLSTDQIIQFSAIRLEPYNKREFHTKFTGIDLRIKPSIPIKPEATAVNQITDDMVKDCPSFKQVADEILTFFADADIGGYNITGFDLPLLAEELLRVGKDFDIQNRMILDTCNTFRKLNPRTLTACYQQYVGETFEAHDALEDTQATIECTMKMQDDVQKAFKIEYLEEWAKEVYNREGLCDFAGKFRRQPDGKVVFNFGKHYNKEVSQEPGMLEWMIGKGFTKDTERWAKLLLKDPTGGRQYSEEVHEVDTTGQDDEHTPTL